MYFEVSGVLNVMSALTRMAPILYMDFGDFYTMSRKINIYILKQDGPLGQKGNCGLPGYVIGINSVVYEGVLTEN